MATSSSALNQPDSTPLTPELTRLKAYLISATINEIGSVQLPGLDTRAEVETILSDIFQKINVNLREDTRQRIFQEVLDELVGYGPIQFMLDDPTVAEIMVNGPDLVFIERDGELIETDVRFESQEHVLRVINRMIHPLGRRIDADNPTVDARLPDGSRVNAVIPPVAVDGPYISIRKFLRNRMSIEELIELGSLTPIMAEFLEACVAARLNILITGGTSSGKTTMLNLLSGLIPGKERIITIEDAAELQLQQRHVVRMETRSPNVDGSGQVSARDLVRNALRMRPDRIVIGEVRGGETLDMLQAMNTGHKGSMTTLHANSPRDAISRIETMAMMAGLDIPILVIRKQIASTFNLIVHQSRLGDGSRKTTQITEVAGMESDVVTLSDIYRFDQVRVDPDGKIIGDMRPTGIRPLFGPRLEVVGYKLRSEIFGGKSSWS
jgi:pilus assembly protein CpaF